MNTMTQARNYISLARQAGLSLVELMISLTIGLLLLLGITTLLVQQNNSRVEMEKSSRQIENGRYAMQLLHDDIQLAGFYAEYSPASAVASVTTADPCATSGNLGWNSATPLVPVAIYGYAGAGADPTPGACLDNYLPNTGILVIRRTATTSIAAAAAVAGTTYLQVSKCRTDAVPFVLGTGGFILYNLDCITTPPGTLASLYPYIVRIYYLSSCSVCAPSDNIPTLKMVEFVNGARSLVPLVEGIENMQFEYGMDGDNNADGVYDDINGDGAVNISDLNGAPDSFSTLPNAAGWTNVVAVKVNLLARNLETTPGYSDNKTYNLGPAASAVTPGGLYKRHAYTQLVRAINPSGRRE